MPLYRVRMCRDTSESVDIDVIAPDAQQAEEAAWQMALNDPNLDWTEDDYWGKPYCPAPEDIEEIHP